MAKLTPKQKRFVDEYLVDLNATQAAKRAGYKNPNIGRQLITKNNVSVEIQQRRERLQKKVEITQEKVLQELASIAFANGADFAAINNDGSVEIKPTSQISPDKLAAIAGMKNNQFGVEIKLHDKVKALEMLCKYLGLFEKSEKGDSEGVQIIDDL